MSRAERLRLYKHTAWNDLRYQPRYLPHRLSIVFNLTSWEHNIATSTTPHYSVAMSDVKSLSPFGIARSTVQGQPLSQEELKKYTQYFHATLYICLG